MSLLRDIEKAIRGLSFAPAHGIIDIEGTVDGVPAVVAGRYDAVKLPVPAMQQRKWRTVKSNETSPLP